MQFLTLENLLYALMVLIFIVVGAIIFRQNIKFMKWISPLKKEVSIKELAKYLFLPIFLTSILPLILILLLYSPKMDTDVVRGGVAIFLEVVFAFTYSIGLSQLRKKKEKE